MERRGCSTSGIFFIVIVGAVLVIVVVVEVVVDIVFSTDVSS